MEDESSDATFDPWMVVTQKRKDNILHKKSNSSPLAEYRHASLNVNEKESLGNGRFEKKVNGPRVTSRNEGKRN